MILGIDEVGRGPWAGPLVVGAAVLNGAKVEGLTDSKKLTKLKRETLYHAIISSPADVGLGWVHAHELDELGLSESLKEATKRAVRQVRAPYHEIIIDGTVNFLVGTPLEAYVTTMKKADLLIASVSAASIVAKVARDAFMEEQDELYPQYGFASHVGYGTAAHNKALQANGMTPLHRRSFGPLKSITRTAAPASIGTTTTAIGNDGENAACDFLLRRGYEIVDRNWKTKICEIDIVARRHDTYYFVEVKHRSGKTTGGGLTAITPTKLKRMTFAARMYAQFNRLDAPLRLAAIATTGAPAEIVSYVEIE